MDSRRFLVMAIVGVHGLLPALSVAGPPIFTSLYSFSGGADGAEPLSTLVIDDSGVLYGTTYAGGTFGSGAIFSLSPPASPGGGWTESVLWSFPTTNSSQPACPQVVLGSGGTLFSTTSFGGTGGVGTVFSLSPPATPGNPWTQTVLYNFQGGVDGSAPLGCLTIDPSGLIYGATQRGGAANAGTIFSLAPPRLAGDSWRETVLYTFTGGDDGFGPATRLLITPDGSLIGTTASGGAKLGTAFSLAPPATPGATWALAVLHNYGGFDSGLTMDGTGGLYGTTVGGGIHYSGSVFSLTPRHSPAKPWHKAVLSTLAAADRANPIGGVVLSNGSLYGTTVGHRGHDGAIFKLKPPASPGQPWRLLVLHKFTGVDGAGPYAGLVKGKNGIFYGVTSHGGNTGSGTVFSVKP